MNYIEGIRVKNYRVLRDISLGSILSENRPGDVSLKVPTFGKRLTPLTVVIGRNGYGKSTLFDAFGFIVDCLKGDVEHACATRGGFDKIVSKDCERVLEFQVRYGNILYSLYIAADDYNVPFVDHESLTHVEPNYWDRDTMNFFVKNGEGKVIRPNSSEVVTEIKLADHRRLALATLGNLTQYPEIVAFRQFLDSWYLCCFSPDAARKTPAIGSQRHLSSSGDNIANVVHYMEREHPIRFQQTIERVISRILGITKISTVQTEDGRLLTQFYEKESPHPFYASQMSDGTLKLIAYMMLLDDPFPPPFVCIEEPENGLYHKLLQVFIDEIRRHTNDKCGSQFFITTHQPYLVDALHPDEVWILDKGDDGYASIRLASDDSIVHEMVQSGHPLGALWYSDYLDHY